MNISLINQFDHKISREQPHCLALTNWISRPEILAEKRPIIQLYFTQTPEVTLTLSSDI